MIDEDVRSPVVPAPGGASKEAILAKELRHPYVVSTLKYIVRSVRNLLTCDCVCCMHAPPRRCIYTQVQHALGRLLGPLSLMVSESSCILPLPCLPLEFEPTLLFLRSWLWLSH